MRNKYHLANLPENENPIPTQVESAGRACVLLPVFEANPHDKSHVGSYVAKSAAWALRSWVSHTDATDHGVPCYIYVNKSCADTAIPILEKNGVPSCRILIGEKEFPSMASFLSAIFDERLKDYEYMVFADADMFVCSPSGKKHTVFDIIFENIKDVVCVSHSHTEKNPMYSDASVGNYWWYAHGSYEKWREVVGDVVPEHILQLYDNGGYRYVNTHINIFCNNTLKEHSKLFEELLEATGHDELILSIWHHLNTEKHLLRDVYGLLNIKNTSKLFDLGNQPFFLHAYQSLDTVWQQLLRQ